MVFEIKNSEHIKKAYYTYGWFSIIEIMIGLVIFILMLYESRNYEVQKKGLFILGGAFLFYLSIVTSIFFIQQANHQQVILEIRKEEY